MTLIFGVFFDGFLWWISVKNICFLPHLNLKQLFAKNVPVSKRKPDEEKIVIAPEDPFVVR